MEWVLGYIIGVLLTVCFLGWLTKDSSLDEEDYRMIFTITALWPIFAFIGVVLGIPFTLFQLVRGEFNDIIKEDVAWIKAKWDSIGNHES